MKSDVRTFLQEFAGHLRGERYTDAGALLAPWLAAGDGVARLTERIQSQIAETRAMFDDMNIGPADSVELDENPLSVAELREEGTPLPDDVTEDNFVQWCCVSIQADEGEWALYDLWCAVVSVAGEFRIGAYDVMSPD